MFRFFYPARSPIDIAHDYNIPHRIRFNFRTKNGSIVATSDDLPGFITEASTPQELLGMLNDGILTYFDVPKKVGDIVHESMTIDGYGTVSLQERHQAV